MGLFEHLRSKSRAKDSHPQTSASLYPPPPHARYGRDFSTRLPETLLEKVFAIVCPHTQDESYEPSERSMIGDGCMLCDLRDLSSCAMVCRRWYHVAQKMLYGSVRIDAVHYCALEELLAETRKKQAKHFRSKSHVEPGDVPSVRLSLLCRTVRASTSLASQVTFLKLPYMTRETSKGDLARTCSALPNLRYVDLPDGFFTGDPSCLTLRQELQARCPDIRKMTYRSGSEDALERLAHRHWQSMEVLELSGVAVEPSTLRIVLASLPTLQELKLSDLDWLDDTIFQKSAGRLPDFPPLQRLVLEEVPHVTAQGLSTYLSQPHNRESLESLTLQGSGIQVQDLHAILWVASSLQHLAILETVTRSLTLSLQEIPPLTSISLKTLHYEISDSEDAHGLQNPASSYYSYLAQSLHANALPALTTLYVRDQDFPELLLLPPIVKPFANGSDAGSQRSTASNNSTGRTFNQTLEVFSKGLDELEWVFTAITPPSHGNRRGSASGGRPLSAYSASRGLGPQWAQGGFGGEARKSVIVGNGFGGFLAVPQDEMPRPLTSDGPAGGARVGSLASQGSASTGHSRASWLKPPPSLGGADAGAKGRRESRQDLWR